MFWLSLKWKEGALRWCRFRPCAAGISRHRYDLQAIPEPGAPALVLRVAHSLEVNRSHSASSRVPFTLRYEGHPFPI
jgi:hypothetical protein